MCTHNPNTSGCIENHPWIVTFLDQRFPIETIMVSSMPVPGALGCRREDDKWAANKRLGHVHGAQGGLTLSLFTLAGLISSNELRRCHEHVSDGNLYLKAIGGRPGLSGMPDHGRVAEEGIKTVSRRIVHKHSSEDVPMHVLASSYGDHSK